MDHILETIVDTVHTTDFSDLPTAAVDRVIRHTLDTVGCGAGGFASAPARIGRRVGHGAGGDMVASVYGAPDRVLVDYAAFANATANRYLDFNDFGVSGHPSDMIPAILAVTESAGGSGQDAVTGIALAYEIATRFAESVPPDGCWDQGIYCTLGIAAGAAKILRLSREKTAHALSLAIVPSIPLRVTRFGELSEWKASATAHTAMTTLFAVRLADLGMTGPPEPFTGKDGLLERVWPNLATIDRPSSTTAIERASLKKHPACYWGQVPIDLALTARSRGITTADVERIDVATCVNAWRSIGGGRDDADEKWRPRTRETADHSMPYLMAVAWVDGGLSDAGFTLDRLSDPELLSLMDRITVTERPELTAAATRDTCPTEVTVVQKNGRTLSVSADAPRGHPDNPMSDTELLAKFDSLVDTAVTRERGGELRTLLWDLPTLSSLDRVAKIFREFGQQRP